MFSTLLGYTTQSDKITVYAKDLQGTNFRFTVVNCFPLFVKQGVDIRRGVFTDTGRVHKLRPLSPLDPGLYCDIANSNGCSDSFRELLFDTEAERNSAERSVGSGNCASRKCFRDGFALLSYHTKVTHMSVFESTLKGGDVVTFQEYLTRVKLTTDSSLVFPFRCAAFDIETSSFSLGDRFAGCSTNEAAVTMISLSVFKSTDTSSVTNYLFRVGGKAELDLFDGKEGTATVHKTTEVLSGPNGERIDGQTYDYKEKLYSSELKMLGAFFMSLTALKLDVFLGFNINGFDWPVLFHRWRALARCELNNVRDYEQLWDAFAPFKDHFGDSIPVAYRFWESKQKGISIDFFPMSPTLINIDLYKWATSGVLKLGAYSLSEVCKDVLRMNKKDVGYEIVFEAWDHINEQGRTDFSVVRDVSDYCIQDSALLVKLFERVSSIYDVIAQASIYDIPASTVYTASTTKRLERTYASHAFDKGFFIPQKAESDDTERFTGGFVNDPATGRHICVCIDANSMYPTCIRCFNLCVTSFVSNIDAFKRTRPDDWQEFVYEVFDDTKPVGCEEADDEMIAEIAGDVVDEEDIVFRRDNAAAFPAVGDFQKFFFFKEEVVDAVIPFIVNSLLKKRKEVRRQMEAMFPPGSSAQDKKAIADSLEHRILDRRQNSFKVAANSIYGLVGSSHGGHKTTAACVTAMSRHLIKLCNKTLVEEHNAFIVYNDTDSVFFKFNQFADMSETDQIVNTHKLCDDVVVPAINAMCKEHGYKLMNFEKEKVGRGLFFTKKKYVFEDFDTEGKYVKTLNTGDAIARRNYTGATKMLYKSLIPMFFDNRGADDINQFIIWFLLALLLGDLEQRLILSSASVKDISETSNSPLAKSVRIANQLDANIKECARFFVIPTMLPHPSVNDVRFFDPKKKGHLQTVHRIFDERMVVRGTSCLENMETPILSLFKAFAPEDFNPLAFVIEHSRFAVGVQKIELPGSATALFSLLDIRDTVLIRGAGTRRVIFLAVLFQRCLEKLVVEIEHFVSHLGRDDYLTFHISRCIMAIGMILSRIVESAALPMSAMKLLSPSAQDLFARSLALCSEVCSEFVNRRLAFTSEKKVTQFSTKFAISASHVVRQNEKFLSERTPASAAIGKHVGCFDGMSMFSLIACWKELIEGKPRSAVSCGGCAISKCQSLSRL